MHSTRQRTLAAEAALLLAAMLWGGGFVVTKQTLDAIPPLWLMTYRFTLAAVCIGLLKPQVWRLLNARALWGGAALGALLFLGYLTQTLGLADSTPGKNAFLTTMYVVEVPFLHWLTLRQRPKADHLLAAGLALVGLALISLTERLRIGRGDMLTLLCSLMFAGHIVGITWLQRHVDAWLLLPLQFGWAALFFWIAALCTSSPAPLSVQSLAPLLYLALVSTMVATSLQNIGQRYTPPSHAALLLSLESVFGCIFSALFWGEHFTPRTLAGFACVLGAVLISQIAPLKQFTKR